ncbi:MULTISPECIES: non-hydrolyzing UDP-N-acetylglucosamine 2-epimerase [Pseudidiomarina]|uniref:UDP-N-acetylglucosamine 2-epimerase (Non-hydrolysing) n=2 Tax=Pseudidiomarina TaxID=2800384 RepID=A0A368UJT8_9GAMM|nr:MULTISPECIES: UDP-N-acetylglucosamine 2-epimerase (non-hydrolyzing) [Pseudidiomarina]PWW06860.1 UDP-N-acetylglucosamine 2-epimerase (non-hydrolysing) [Pseudidiomarina maritima]RBP86602.1 UDP-N-acetylglucosamine 2-epimerase (non-hydrolysing) [Pseudidiomarina tainanensis]RCW28879.1 UDP-N-acetylglucosamine 2-epimerase (non-hydrolysing) [Pseudidiomarina tainanensis]
MKKLKVMTILGTRPEIIRLSRVMAALDQVVDHKIVHTGQNYDYELNDVFFEELGVRQPDHFLSVDTSSLGKSLGEILIKTEQVILEEKPDAVLVLGDTNSATATIMAKRMKVPTYHMEAGNRSFDANVPEEINRKLVDHLADFNLVYTEHARRHLISEGLSHRFIYLTGSPMREVLEHSLESIQKSNVLEQLELEAGKFFIVSVHREENVDSKANLAKVVEALNALYEEYGYPIVVSTHPRTRNRLEKLGLDKVTGDIRFLKPFGFFDYNKLQMEAFCAISDSGTISEESSILDFPAVTMRRSIERPEALDTGAIALTGLDKETLIEGVRIATASREVFSGAEREIPEEYKIRNTSERVVRLITGTAKLTLHWKNMDSFSRYDW